LIGIPVRVLVSKKTLEKGMVELKKRSEKEAQLVPATDIQKFL
jgi:prolyl-tRNA synthetase